MTQAQQPAAAIDSARRVAFVGDSITAAGRWQQLFPHWHCGNFGVDGDRSDQVLLRLGAVIDFRPARLFLLIGTNDLGCSVEEGVIVDNVGRILRQLRQALPDCQLCLQTVLPREQAYAGAVRALNRRYAQLAQEHAVALLDLYPLFDDGHGRLRAGLTEDGLHLLDAGYTLWQQALAPALA